MRANKLRSDSIATYMLRAINETGICFVKDLKLYGSAFSARVNVNSAYRKLCELNYIAEVRLDKLHPYVRITIHGKNYLADLLGREQVLREELLAGINTSDQKKLKRKLAQSRIQLILETAGINCFCYNKPSLLDVVRFKNPYIEIKDNFEIQKWLYQTQSDINSNYEDCWLYYSSLEVRSFLDSQSPSLSDTIRGSRFYGIIISRKQYYIVYSAVPENNKVIRLSENVECRLVSLLRNYFGIEEYDYRELFSGYSTLPYDCIVFCDNDSFIKSMISSASSNPRTPQRPNNGAKKYHFLNSSSTFYRKIYTVPASPNGLIAAKNIFELSDDIKNNLNSFLEYECNYKTFENMMSINPSFDLKQIKALPSWINDSYYADGVIAVPNAKFAEIISSAINEEINAVSFDGKTLGTFGHHSDIESVHSQSNKTKRYYRKRTSICGSKENIELIKKAAANNKLSVSRYILKTIMPLVRDELNK